MPLLPYDYLHLVNCPEVVIISDILCSENRRERVKRALMEMAIQSEFRDRLCWGFAKAGERRSSLHKKERGVMKVNETASGRMECSRYWFQGTQRLDPYIHSVWV